jgi:hypothetical protein
MAEHTHSGTAELGAPMDYAQHERTFEGFVSFTKISVLANIAILQSLALFGLASNGFWAGMLMLLLTTIGTVVAFITKGSLKTLIGVVLVGFVLMALMLG